MLPLLLSKSRTHGRVCLLRRAREVAHLHSPGAAYGLSDICACIAVMRSLLRSPQLMTGSTAKQNGL
jgi:hypothetical protein